MATLYLDRKQAILGHSGQSLEIRREGRQVQRIPFRQIHHLVIRGRAHIDTATLGALADAGIGISLLSGRHSRRQASLVGPYGKAVQRRLNQYRAWNTPGQAARIAACLLAGKIQAQRRLLQEAGRQRPDLRHPLRKALVTLESLQKKIVNAGELDTLRGLEGAAAAAYFGAYRHLFAPGLGFSARRRRPPPDPVNAALSLGYTLLHNEAVLQAHALGLDPYLGYLHEPAHGRESLAADLIEPLRPRLDAMVWRLFRERILHGDHFRSQQNACLLGKRGRQRYYAAYEANALPWRRWQRRALLRLVRHLENLA